MNAARSLSRRQLCGASRVPSRHGANGARSSTLPISSPGLSSPSTSSVRFFRTLELRLGDEPQSRRADYSPTPRDMAILMALDSYRYLDRSQLQTLFFAGRRSCQYRLRWLVDRGLVRAWHVVMRPGRVCRASIYPLSRRGAAARAECLDGKPLPYLRPPAQPPNRRDPLALPT